MRIIFMGTGEIGLPALRWLLDESGHEIVGVFTQPDRAVGRSGKLQSPEVKMLAEAKGIPVFQPEKLRGDDVALDGLRALNPELIVVVAYGQILPKAVLEAPSIACINLHASLLPRHRGASPIQAAIRDGDAQSGMTVMHVKAKLDAGDTILAETTRIGAEDTGSSLHDRLAAMGVPALTRALPLLENGTAPRTVQDEALVTHCGKLSRQDGRIDWTKSAVELERSIRAYHPWPGTHTHLPDGKMLKIFPMVEVVSTIDGAEPGEVKLDAESAGFVVATGDGGLRVGQGAWIQLEGRRRVAVADFLAGRGLEDGTLLGDPQH